MPPRACRRQLEIAERHGPQIDVFIDKAMPVNYSTTGRLSPFTAAVLALGLLTALPRSSTFGQSPKAKAAPQADVVALGKRYAAGAVHRFFFGRRYRDLWATPIEVEVLDLKTFAGGLTPVRLGGSGQTKSLHLDGADGRRYVFRSIDKTLHVPEDFHDTFVENVMQDMKISAFHPAAALVAAPLLEAADVLHADPQLVELPDDPLLGEFRKDFAGVVGMIEERPNEGPDDTPGFAGSSKVVGTEKLLKNLESSSHHRVDERDFVKSKLMDIWFGDRDRHVDQWRWASYVRGEDIVWRPIPRDRDEPFVANDGLLWRVARLHLPRFSSFREKYGDIAGLTENGWDLDRMLLGGLERSVWDSVAVALQNALTDSVISAAVRQMPIEMYRKSGAELERELRARRDSLRKAAYAYYMFISKEVDVYGTDEADIALVKYGDDGLMEVTLRRSDEKSHSAGSAPYFRRQFRPEETHEVRLYLRGGADSLLVTGTGAKKIVVRAIGGGGADTMADSTTSGGSGVRFYDGRGDNHFITNRGTTVDVGDYKRPRPSGVGPHEFILDWGGARYKGLLVRANAENGLILGAGILRYDYGFRKAPYRHRLHVRGALATSGRVMFDYESRYGQVLPHSDLSLHTWLSGVEPINFYGFGNETGNGRSTVFYKVDTYQLVVDPALMYTPFSLAKLSIGPVFKYSNTSDASNRLVQDSLYGANNFSQLGAQLSVELDARGQFVDVAREYFGQRRWASGLNVKARLSFYPAILDVVDMFGEASVEATPYFSLRIPTEPTLAMRLGAKKVWGENEIPFREAAYVGGSSTLRGFRSFRFAGDAAVYGDANVRFSLARFLFLFPTEFGVLGLADAGRVYVDRDSPGGWHTAAGGGVWFAPMRRAYTVSIAVAKSTEGTPIYVSVGFIF